MKLVKAVGALDEVDLNGIIVFSKKTKQKILIIERITIGMLKENPFRDKLWIAKYPEIVEAIEKEFSEGPFEYIVLFLED